MHHYQFLDEFVLLGLSAILIIILSRRFSLPPIIGLISTGIVLGPTGLGIVSSDDSIEIMSEFGIVLLLFTIGLEFSLDELRRLRRIVGIGGTLQVGLTIVLIYAAATWLAVPLLHEACSWQQAVFLGMAFSVSSTAICLKLLKDRGELGASHGRLALGILLFQDAAVVPLMIVAAMLNPQAEISLPQAALKLVGTVAVAAAAIVGFKFVMPRLARMISNVRAQEVVVLGALTIAFGAALLTSFVGLSLALGAFIAGMVLASTDESREIEHAISPIRDALTSVFFISIGLLLNLSVDDLPGAMLGALGLLAIKAFVVFVVARILGYSNRIAVMGGVILAQVGEFSFVIAEIGRVNGIIGGEIYQLMLASIVITLIVTPALISFAPSIADKVAHKIPYAIIPIKQQTSDTLPADGGEQHSAVDVVIVGYGVNGRSIASACTAAGLSYRVIEMNRETVESCSQAGIPIVYGDATDPHFLKRAGVTDASVVVVVISDGSALQRVVASARALSKEARIIVRTRYYRGSEELYKVGATFVIPEELESAVQIFATVLQQFSVPQPVIREQAEYIRKNHYGMLVPAAIEGHATDDSLRAA